MRGNLIETNKSGTKITDPTILYQESKCGYKTGTYCDGAGLYLKVGGPRQASWLYRWKQHWLGLGSADIYRIDQAREMARPLWEAACKGQDVIALHKALRSPETAPVTPEAATLAKAEKPAGKLKGKQFCTAMDEYLAAKSPHWAASNRARETRRHEYLFGLIPDFVSLRLSEIDQDAKNKALATWNENPKARADVGFYIEAIIRFAETGKLRIVKRGDDSEHHFEAMPYADVPAFYDRILKLNSGGDDARALRFTILTSARTDEVIGATFKGETTKAPATWGEIGEVKGKPMWIIPSDRMKGGRTHHVAMTPQMLVLLGDRQADDVPLFTVSGSNAMLNVLKANGGNGYTVHGMRSSFSDWVIEQTSYGADLADMCIAHLTRGAVRKAYQRSPQLDKRREIMQGWSDFVTKL